MPPASSDAASKKGRAKHACRVCNSRRVRCNVIEAQPCDNCVSSGAICEVLPSKRGRYPRRNRQSQHGSTAGVPQSASPHAGAGGSALQSSPTIASSIQVLPPPQVIKPPRPGSSASFRRPSRPDVGATPMTNASPAAGTLFFGESNFLTLVPGDHASAESHTGSGGGQRQRLMFPVPETPQSHQSPTAGTSVSAATMRYLRDEGALTLPDLQTCVPALQAYFTWFHPCFPVVDRADFVRRLASMEVSQLLLQAMLFIGATYCDESTIRSMGFADRSEAKNLLYTRARMLFHADWETDGVTLIQSVFLMSFWRGAPSDIRDVRYWLGVVISLAESYGLHRSEKFMSKDPRLFRIRRRIWWSIYVRERQAAASLGLPSRIRDEDCDIEPLNASDLESDAEAATISMFGSCQPHHITYAVKMVEVARLLGSIIDLHFVPGQQPASEEEIQDLDERLENWKNSLPDNMQYSSDEGSASIWTCLLHLAYNHLRILIHRSSFLKFAKDDSSNQVVINAACRISRIAEDMSTQGTLRYGQMHLITSLFAALCIHTIDIRRNNGMSQRIAEHRAQLCLLCLKEIQKYWRINNTVLDLFLQYLDTSIVKRLHGTPQASGIADDSTAVSTVTTTAGDMPATTPISPAPKMDESQAPTVSSAMIETHPGRPPVGMYEDQFFNLVTGHWEGDDALGDLGLFLQGDDFMHQEGLNFLGRSL